MSTWESRSISALPLQCHWLVELQAPSTQPWPAARRNRQVVLVQLLAGTWALLPEKFKRSFLSSGAKTPEPRHQPLKKKSLGHVKHTVRLSIAQSTVMCGVVLSPAGADAGRRSEAADHELLRKYYIPVTAVALAVVLSGLVGSCVVISRLRKRDP